MSIAIAREGRVRVWVRGACALMLCGVFLSASVWAATPPLNANAWNIVIVPSFEPNPDTNTLSVTGFNHALQFAQLLNLLTAGKTAQVRQIMAFSAKATPTDITPLQSIQPYAVLNNRAVSQLIVDPGDLATYNSPSYNLAAILADQAPGHYIVAMPATMINEAVTPLLDAGTRFAGIPAGDFGQYVVLSRENNRTTATMYDDDITPAAHYPDVALAPERDTTCPQTSTRFTVPKPKSPRFLLNANQTVHLIRHVEAHPNSDFENGNFVCQGAWRAIGANGILNRLMGGPPDQIFTTNPNDLIDCDGSCSYIRPTLTIAPYAVAHGMPLALAAFQWDDPDTLAAALFTQNTPYSDPHFNGTRTLVAWEHGNIVKAIKYLIGGIYQAPETVAKIPDWSFTDYDSVWVIKTDAKGNLTFSNDCEHVDTAALPSTCPAFPSGIRSP
ncbi:hypothetical protein C7S18_10485 [Ahniella affigens]|uniref:PBP domain-containing protein n=1 Tax=Ahniella affigens TaxID=2021234 RepID=A0A2P1PRZ5_9GAMM|nr:hypothetical protein [Ahniella affigens]AVP97598.1 hypothetical protein C7S18_10485 [Ahniella affigens]